MGRIGVEPNPLIGGVFDSAKAEIRESFRPFNQINHTPQAFVLDGKKNLVLAARQIEIGVQRARIGGVIAPNQQVLTGLQCNTRQRPSSGLHQAIAQMQTACVRRDIASVDQFDPIAGIAIFIRTEAIVDGHDFVDEEGRVSKRIPNP
jgi:hypothetical protein